MEKMKIKKTISPSRHASAIAVLAVLYGLLLPAAAIADLADQPVPWNVFIDYPNPGHNVYPKTANGDPLHDYESSADPSSGGTGVGADPIDIGSEWDGIDDPTAPHELCNPDLSAVTANGRCGAANSAYWGYWTGNDPDDYTDDVIFLRMLLVGTPAAGGNALDFGADHWNFLIDTDFDGFKDYWLDLDGGFNEGSASNRIDHIQLLYEPTDIPEIQCGGGEATQLVVDPDDARVAEFTACAIDWQTAPSGHPCENSHTRIVPNSTGSQFYLEVQMPITALKDLDCANCGPGGTGGGPCVPGNQIVFPIPGGAPDVAYLFSTGNSGVDPLQKDYIADCNLSGSPPDGPCSFPDSTPVSLASVSSRQNGAAVSVAWTTATQTATMGFNIYGVDERGWRRLNEHLIPAPVADTLEPQRFSFEALSETELIGIEDVDVFGTRRRHGPFGVGSPNGRAPDAAATDWARVRSEAERFATGSIKTGPLKGRGRGWPTADLMVEHDGLYRVGHQELVAAGFDFAGAPADHIALIGRDGPVPILVSGGPVIGPGSTIEFVGDAADGLYTRQNHLRLTVDPTLTRRIKIDRRPPEPGQTAPWYMAVHRVENQVEYSFSTPVDDPWFDTSMLAYTTPKEWSFELRADDLTAVAAAELDVQLWGGTDWPAAPDHRVELLVNGAQVAERTFDGLTAQRLTATIPKGVLQPGVNTMTIRLPGDTGVDWDLIRLDSYEIRYPRPFLANGNVFEFRAAGEVLRIDELPTNQVVIYALEPVPTRISGMIFERSGSGYSVIFGGTEKPTEHLITTYDAALSPVLSSPVVGRPPISEVNDLLIIAHPQFVEGIAALAAARRAEGLAVEIVDLDQIYGAYGNGNIDPASIAAYIADAHEFMGTRFVLLVGGDTLDYHDHLGIGSISFIPTFYAATDQYITHAPVDPLYGDVDGDGVPEVAVGRFPVRTQDELDRLVAKTLAFDNHVSSASSAVIAADAYDSAQDLLFTGFAETLATDLPSKWTISRAYVDTVGFDDARNLLIDQINQGSILTSYIGHSGPTMWSFDGLFHVDDVAQLTNFGQPTMALQWGCWNTYFVEPRYDSIGMALLLHGDQGAASVIGSTTLSWVPSARAFSELLVPRLVQPGTRVGEAVTAAKRELADNHGNIDDVVLGWTLLGDPTLQLVPGSVSGDHR